MSDKRLLYKSIELSSNTIPAVIFSNPDVSFRYGIFVRLNGDSSIYFEIDNTDMYTITHFKKINYDFSLFKSGDDYILQIYNENGTYSGTFHISFKIITGSLNISNFGKTAAVNSIPLIFSSNLENTLGDFKTTDATLNFSKIATNQIDGQTYFHKAFIDNNNFNILYTDKITEEKEVLSFTEAIARIIADEFPFSGTGTLTNEE